MRTAIYLILTLLVACPDSVLAAKPIKFNIKKLGAEGTRVLAISLDGKSESLSVGASSTRVVIPSPGSRMRLFVLRDNAVVAQIVNKFCSKATSGAENGQYVRCSRKNKVNTVFRAGASLGRLNTTRTGAWLANLRATKYRQFVVPGITALASNWVPVGISSHGLAARNSQSLEVTKRRLRINGGTTDIDDDGLPAALDSDDDGDGVLDNYDSNNPPPAEANNSFWLFSNLKLDIENSLNLHATGLDKSRIDQALQSVQTLAIQVAGSNTELDCGTLQYCSSGGTGTMAEGGQPFPGTPGGALDADADGYGTITPGSTGDFQLRTNASSDTITGGDAMIERIDNGDGSETELPGILNFVFNSTPALKSVTTSLGTSTLDYSSAPYSGSRNNCIAVPASGDVTLDITAWRPQRPGVAAAGEAEYVDLGHSLVTLDIPNGPCATQNGDGCEPEGPGNCSSASYSTSDPELSAGPNGIEDNKNDQDADAANTLTFTVNLTQCLNDASGGAISWESGETLFLDLQFKSSRGDNAAQKFCVTRQ